MNESIDCQKCQEHSGFKVSIDELNEFKRKMTNGTIERLWSAIDKKATKAMSVTVIVLIMGLVGTLFGLVYRSQNQMLHEMVNIKTSIAIIEEKIK